MKAALFCGRLHDVVVRGSSDAVYSGCVTLLVNGIVPFIVDAQKFNLVSERHVRRQIGILFALVIGEITELASVENDVPGYDR